MFHAKGGEVALLGSPWDLHGFGHKHMRLSFLCACVHLFASVVNLGLPIFEFYLLKSDETLFYHVWLRLLVLFMLMV